MSSHRTKNARILRPAKVLLIVLSMIVPAEAAKVLRFLSPFGNTNIWVSGGPFGFAPGSDPNTLMKLAADNWMELALPAGAAIDKYSFVVMPDWQYQQATPDLTAILTAGDTAWILPEPSPNGPLKAFGSRPKTKTVMLWNPWEAPSPRRTPYMQVEGRAWGPMSQVVRLPGWYTADITGYNSMSLLFTDSAKSAYFGGGGVTATASSPMVLDSIASRSDTLWIRARPEPVGAPFASSTRPRPKVAMVFNPWRGQKPLAQPRLTLGTLGPVAMTSSLEYCGWYTFEFYERAGGALLTHSRSGQKVGAAGFDDATTFDISTLLATQDTAWIMTDSVSGKPSVNKGWAGQKGLCEVVLLASTIHDFPSGSPSDRQFGAGSGCGQGNWGVVKGMVEGVLGADRKPVRSKHDRGSKGIPNEWGGMEYGFRCEYDTGASAEVGDSGISTEWFRDVPGRNASTCRDIPLQLDSVNGTYSYQSKYFFPIDDFGRLADGSPNPYFDQIRGEDQKLHNYAFCLESHGDFDYRKGQSYDFTGDDDVWFFVDNRLVVDLGGIHPASSQKVLLDTIGRVITRRDSSWNSPLDTTWSDRRLVEGRTYTWDFFFCERNPAGSSMKITTSMNLRTDGEFQVKTTPNGPGSTKFDIYTSATKGQGCQAVSSVVRTSGRFLLAGGQFPSPHRLSTGTWYGGIAIDSAEGTAKLDSASIAGLAPGRYVLRIVSISDSTAAKEFPFTVPFTTGPRFTAKPPYAGLVGTALAVSVSSFNKTGPDSAWVKFVVHPQSGLKFYRDSTLTTEIVLGDTLRTGSNTLPRRFWVVGSLAGTYVLKIGATSTDTADVYPSVVFQGRGLRFVDAAGTPISPLDAISLDLGQSKQIFVQAVAGGAPCLDCVGPLRLDGSNGLVFSATQDGAATDNVPLTGALASFWVRAAGSVKNGSLRATLASDTMAQAVWSPVHTNGYRLRFVDPNGNVADTLAPVDRRVLTGQTISVQVWGTASACASCSGVLRFSPSVPGLVLQDDLGRKTDSVVIANGAASFIVWGDAPVAKGAVALEAPSLLAEAIATPLTFRPFAPESLLVYDGDGDGRADSVRVVLRQPWKTGNTLSLSWPDAASTTALQGSVPAAFDGDSGVLSFRLPAPLGIDHTSDVAAKAAFSWNGTSSLDIPVFDRIAPVPVSATIAWGSGTAPDTLRVKLSESVKANLPSRPLSILREGTWPTTAELSARLSNDDELVLLFDAATPANTPVPGDRVRLSSGGVGDLFGNTPGSNPKSALVAGPQRPPRRGWYQDTDGDGRIDRAMFQFANALRGEAGLFDLALPGAGEKTSLPGRILSSDSTLVAVDLDDPFPFGTTAFPEGPWAGSHGGQKVSIADSVAPHIDTAFVRLTETYDGADTLFVVPTEPLRGAAAVSWFRSTSGGAAQIVAGGMLPARGDTLVVLMPSDGIGAVRAGDSLRYVATGEVSDLRGNQPSSRMHWRKVGGGLRPPLVRVLPPKGRIDRPEVGLDLVAIGGIQIVATGSAGWKAWNPATGYQGASDCDTTVCSGPGLELNAPARLSIAIYDRIGTHVASQELDITAEALAAMEMDRLGRTKVRFLWNGTTSDRRPVASGIYLFRLVVRSTAADGSLKVLNKVWTTGLKRP